MRIRLTDSPSIRFLISISGLLVLAFLLPEAGQKGGWLFSQYTVPCAIIGIFFLQGLLLKGADWAQSVKRWPLHLSIQLGIYLLWPTMLCVLMLLVPASWPNSLRMGILFLAVLPTTLSTSTVFTTLAGGSVVTALTNVALSSFLSVLIVPLVFLGVSSGFSVELMSPVIFKLILWMLLPLVCGQWVGKHFAALKERFQPKRIATINTRLVLYIAFCAFCEQASSALALDSMSLVVAEVLCFTFVALGFMHALAVGVAMITTSDPSERVAAVYCIAQKSLGAGIPMATLILPQVGIERVPDPALFMVPILCYHPFQLLLGSYLAPFLRCWLGGKSDQS
jgi:sodium/bile acid cotransporter 7